MKSRRQINKKLSTCIGLLNEARNTKGDMSQERIEAAIAITEMHLEDIRNIIHPPEPKEILIIDQRGGQWKYL